MKRISRHEPAVVRELHHLLSDLRAYQARRRKGEVRLVPSREAVLTPEPGRRHDGGAHLTAVSGLRAAS